MKRLGDSEQLKVLLHSFQAILDDPTRVKPEPPAHYDWSNFDADYYHLNGLIQAGRNRSLAVNDPFCNTCVGGYEFVRDGIHPNAFARATARVLSRRRTIRPTSRLTIPWAAVHSCTHPYSQ